MQGFCRGFCFHVPAIPAFAQGVKGCAGSGHFPMGGILHQLWPKKEEIISNLLHCGIIAGKLIYCPLFVRKEALRPGSVFSLLTVYGFIKWLR
ncbi:hypothetical protein HNR65_000559 [Desulfosalsimonas propionicica]|uniref:Uncharacterized protein n=1 Tax=Desulfosalsimonas propionicica TaxID=332175 RepID=A0A7W0C6Z2_9BACT|nr:hypothetical protein [Desulfosalsimonas propionicica]MBA2880252.1 hypothetical protein [Desulfosalsimonas propionicica]